MKYDLYSTDAMYAPVEFFVILGSHIDAYELVQDALAAGIFKSWHK